MQRMLRLLFSSRTPPSMQRLLRIFRFLADQEAMMQLTVSRVQGSSTPVSANYITLPGTGVEGQVPPLSYQLPPYLANCRPILGTLTLSQWLIGAPQFAEPRLF
jgi:hypothetical protein